MSETVRALSTVRSLLRYFQVPAASLSRSGTWPMVALAPLKLPRSDEPAMLPVSREASDTTGDVDFPSRIASLLKANCLPETRPDDAARWNGELPRRPLTTGPFSRALTITAPPGLL